MLQRKVLVIGSLNMDQVVRVSHMPLAGETLLGVGSLKLAPGGKGANQAVALARLGGHVSMAGRIGNDPFGEKLLDSLRANAVETTLIAIDGQEASGVAFIFLTPAGNNAIVVASGANSRLGEEPGQMQAILAAITQASAVVLQMEIPLRTVITCIEAAYKAGVPVALNLAPAQPLPLETLAQLHTLILNESEANLLSGQRVESLEDARIVATVLHEQGIPNVVITLGAHGAMLACSEESGKRRIYVQPAPRVQVIDTTAAGDCFVAALTVALTEQQPSQEALRFAVYASALKVTRFGAQTGLPDRAEVEDFIRTASSTST